MSNTDDKVLSHTTIGNWAVLTIEKLDHYEVVAKNGTPKDTLTITCSRYIEYALAAEWHNMICTNIIDHGDPGEIENLVVRGVTGNTR